MVRLYVYPKGEEPFTFALEGGDVAVGRAAGNDLALPDQFCSSRHALFVATPDGFAIRDQGSKNGVFVNGVKILAETPLRKGDEILLGSTRILFDEQAPTRVEMVEGPASFDTMIQVRDILKRPAPDTRAVPVQTPGVDLDLLRREQKVLFVLTQVSQALIHHFPLDKLLDHIMDLIIQNIPMDRGVLMLQEGRPLRLVPKVVRIVDPSLRNQNIQVSRSILNTALAKNTAILLSDLQADSFFREQASVVRSNVRSAMCVPMWNNEEIAGIVYADRASIANPFTEDDLKLLTLLANVAAVKIENARLFEESLEKCRMEREMAVAAQIQRAFLPSEEPRLEGYEVCGGNLGCYQIGGDYYDFIPLEGGRLGLTIADVSGCGVGPSLLMASLRASLHAELGARTSLAELAQKLNAFVHKSSESHTFITFFFGILDPATGGLAYVNAGHNPPVLLEAGGGVRRLESSGFCLGMFGDVDYGSGEVRLAPGDLLCLFTDGITEGRNPAGREDFGEERLIGLLRENAGAGVRALMDRVFEDVKAFTSCSEPTDDMTLVLVRRSV